MAPRPPPPGAGPPPGPGMLLSSAGLRAHRLVMPRAKPRGSSGGFRCGFEKTSRRFPVAVPRYSCGKPQFPAEERTLPTRSEAMFPLNFFHIEMEKKSYTSYFFKGILSIFHLIFHLFVVKVLSTQLLKSQSADSLLNSDMDTAPPLAVPINHTWTDSLGQRSKDTDTASSAHSNPNPPQTYDAFLSLVTNKGNDARAAKLQSKLCFYSSMSFFLLVFFFLVCP